MTKDESQEQATRVDEGQPPAGPPTGSTAAEAMAVLNDLGLGDGATLASVQRQLHVNTPTAMRLFALKAAVLAMWLESALTVDAGTVASGRARPNAGEQETCPAPENKIDRPVEE